MKKLLSTFAFVTLFIGLGLTAYVAFPSNGEAAPLDSQDFEAGSSSGGAAVNVPAVGNSDFNWIALPLNDSSLAMASDLKTHVENTSGVTVDAVERWNATAQSYDTFTTVPFPIGNFALEVGKAYRISVSGGGVDVVWSLVGDVPDPSIFSYSLKETASSDFNWIMLPLNQGGITMASDLEAAIESGSSGSVTVDAISKWNASAQSFDTYSTVPFPLGDFAVQIGYPYRISVSGVSGGEVTWPSN